MNIDERIEKALIKYLDAVHFISASKAWLDETEHRSYFYAGCDTCGYGAPDSEFSFSIRYSPLEGPRNGNHSVEIEGDPLNFFPVLFGFVSE